MVVVKLDPDLRMTGQGSFSMILSKQLYVSLTFNQGSGDSILSMQFFNGHFFQIQDDDEHSLFTRVDERLQALTGKAVSEPKAKPPLTSVVWGCGAQGEIFRKGLIMKF